MEFLDVKALTQCVKRVILKRVLNELGFLKEGLVMYVSSLKL